MAYVLNLPVPTYPYGVVLYFLQSLHDVFCPLSETVNSLREEIVFSDFGL